MTYKIWDKQESINGVNAEEVLLTLNLIDDDEVFLVIDEYGTVRNIEIVRIIKGAYGFPVEYTAEDTAQAYIDRVYNAEQVSSYMNEPTVTDVLLKLEELTELIKNKL